MRINATMQQQIDNTVWVSYMVFTHRKGKEKKRKHTRNKLKSIKIARNHHTLYILG